MNLFDRVIAANSGMAIRSHSEAMASIRAILDDLAAKMREQGQKANTYSKQEQWEAAALLIEQESK